MANIRKASETEAIRKKVLLSAERLFIEKGYGQTFAKEISEATGIPTNTVFYEMKTEEDILCGLVAVVCLQLYMAEISEDMRSLYLAAYSLPKTNEAVSKKLK